ncbi:hypothetical protein [Actinoplanes sp. L3-i22]|uniref:hypothetical protein n=1 Tax=Actinoplanes sp. L3-i22 TaxID=2836373 RepID=UPI001C742389|nr:hypothetical protein [Actinoplanes sp. L3-i22]BCY11417.1 hypothetical protein L3i22_065050 [Actinoplanes sp. L3-i22]
MTDRRLVWGSATGVTLAAVNSAVINELHGGRLWWVAAAGCTVAGAVLAGWLATGSAARRIGRGAVVAGRDIAGKVRTDGSAPAGTGVQPPPEVDSGAVVAGRDIAAGAEIDTTGRGTTGR